MEDGEPRRPFYARIVAGRGPALYPGPSSEGDLVYLLTSTPSESGSTR
jgi:hypothetical protein